MASDTSRRDEPNAKGQPGKDGPSVGVGVLWMVGVAGLWTLALVLLHNVADRLLGR
jgi:hypothetical protein